MCGIDSEDSVCWEIFYDTSTIKVRGSCRITGGTGWLARGKSYPRGEKIECYAGFS